ncbi:MAG: arginine--tRNA ligase [Rickettsiales bacterium]|jgi:arginyl-tRNA synthetase|nr:arginine--tRNA ligase [Rickettsiales bacterium]
MSFYETILSEIRTAVGVGDLALEVPREKSFGDFSTNAAMQLAKSEHKPPREIAAAILPKITALPFVESADIAGAGFINIKIKNQFIIESVNAPSPKSLVPNPLTIDMDYGAYNVAKSLHIGHLRGSVIGDTFYRIARFLGHRPISYNHMGDWGRPMASVIAWIIRKFPGDWSRADFQINESEFNDYYPLAAALTKTDADFLAQVLEIKREFQDGEPRYTALYEKMLAISMRQMHDAEARLNMLPFDNDLGERNAAKYLPAAEKILRAKNMLSMSDGAEIVELKRADDKAPMPPLMWLDSRGADTYDSTDIATIYYRKITDNPDRIIYFTDYRQQLHFDMVFRTADMAGLFPSDRLEFPYFGGINGPDGRPLKTRDGAAAGLADIIGMVDDAARARNPDLPAETNKMISLAALRFNELMHDRKSDYIFDADDVVKFEGRTGPYILYTAVRLNSVLKKSEVVTPRRAAGPDRGAQVISITADYERDLLLKILEFPRAVQGAFDRRSPDILANYTYDLCQTANGFYHNCPVKDDPSRLAITRRAIDTLSTCIDLMGMKVPDEM